MTLQLLQMHVFDNLINNTDRKSGHCLLADGKVDGFGGKIAPGKGLGQVGFK